MCCCVWQVKNPHGYVAVQRDFERTGVDWRAVAVAHSGETEALLHFPLNCFAQCPQLPLVALRLTVVTKAENDSHLNGIGLHYHGQVGESGSHYGGLQRALAAARRETRQNEKKSQGTELYCV